MNREWRHGSIALMPGYALLDAEGQPVEHLPEVEFAIEGGFANVRVPGRTDTQVVSAPALNLIICTSIGGSK